MIPLSEAIEANDSKVIRARFKTAGFTPPKIKWDPALEDIDHKELRFLLGYWRDLRGEAEMPHMSKVDALDLRPCLGYLMILDIGEEELTYRVYGSKIARASGFDMTGKTVSAITSHSFIPTFFNACYRAAKRRRLPLLTEHQAPPEVSVFNWTRLILPLADDSGAITRFLAGNIPGPFRIARPATTPPY
jgi:hypothetical protein